MYILPCCGWLRGDESAKREARRARLSQGTGRLTGRVLISQWESGRSGQRWLMLFAPKPIHSPLTRSNNLHSRPNGTTRSARPLRGARGRSVCRLSVHLTAVNGAGTSVCILARPIWSAKRGGRQREVRETEREACTAHQRNGGTGSTNHQPAPPVVSIRPPVSPLSPTRTQAWTGK